MEKEEAKPFVGANGKESMASNENSDSSPEVVRHSCSVINQAGRYEELVAKQLSFFALEDSLKIGATEFQQSESSFVAASDISFDQELQNVLPIEVEADVDYKKKLEDAEEQIAALKREKGTLSAIVQEVREFIASEEKICTIKSQLNSLRATLNILQPIIIKNVANEKVTNSKIEQLLKCLSMICKLGGLLDMKIVHDMGLIIEQMKAILRVFNEKAESEEELVDCFLEEILKKTVCLRLTDNISKLKLEEIKTGCFSLPSETTEIDENLDGSNADLASGDYERECDTSIQQLLETTHQEAMEDDGFSKDSAEKTEDEALQKFELEFDCLPFDDEVIKKIKVIFNQYKESRGKVADNLEKIGTMEFKQSEIIQELRKKLNDAIIEGSLERTTELWRVFDLTASIVSPQTNILQDKYNFFSTAIEHQRLDMINFFIHKGFPLDYDFVGLPLLHKAVDTGNMELVHLILDEGAEINGKSKGFTPESTKVRANSDLLFHDGSTALHHASANNQLSIVQMLLFHGADIFQRDDANVSAIHHAAQRGHTKVVDLLLERGARDCEPDTYSGLHTTPMDYAAKRGVDNLVQFIDKKREDLEQTIQYAMWVASKKRDPEMMKAIYDHYNISKFNNFIGVKNIKEIALNHSSRFGPKRLIEFILDSGVDVNFKGWFGFTSLHRAAEYGRAEITQLLLDHGANVNATTSDDKLTPLFYAVEGTMEGGDYTAVIQQLLDKQADVFSKDSDGNNIVDFGIDMESVDNLKYLLGWLIETHIENLDEIAELLLSTQCHEGLSKFVDRFKRRCEREMQQMMDPIGDTSITFYNLLKAPTLNQSASCARNEKIKEIFESEDLVTSKFPIKGSALVEAYQRGVTRNSLMKRARVVFYSSKGEKLQKLPINVIDHIFGFLSNQDLINLME